MGSRTEDHLSRLAMPKSWDVKRKGIKFVTRPNPGMHTLKLGMPLNVVFRDLLKIVKSTKEAKRLFLNQDILVDGKKRKDFRFIVGIMDVISILKIKKNYRLLLTKKGKLTCVEIDDKEAKLKPCKINGKSQLKKKIQLNLFDGRNVLVDKSDNKVGDTVLIEIPSQKITQSFKLEKGASIFLIGGKHIGETGVVEEIQGKRIVYKKDKEVYETSKRYAFVIGKDKPSIKLPWMLWNKLG